VAKLAFFSIQIDYCIFQIRLARRRK